MPNLIHLFRLQQIDTQIESLEEEIVEMEASAKSKPALDAAQLELDRAGLKKRDAERGLKDSELALSSLESEKKAVEKKLYGGTVNNSKELTQLQKDLEQFDKRREKSDEQVLRGMENLDKIQAEWNQKEKMFQEAKSRFDEELGVNASNKEKLSRHLSELQGRREQFVQSVEPSLLELYNSLKAKKRGVAIVSIQKNACGGCFMAVSESAISKAKDLELVFCASCGRILYLDKEMSKTLGESYH